MKGPTLPPALSGAVGSLLLRSIFATVRCRREGYEPVDALRAEGRPIVFALWHGHLLPLLHFHRKQGIVGLISQHRDGEHLLSVLDRSGFGAVRGSSTRGGVLGLRGLVRRSREGFDVAITPDGPQGPRRSFKPGALAVARLTGNPVVPVAAGMGRAWRLKSWDRFLIPKPFATVHIAYGEPVFVPRHEDRRSTDDLVRRFEAELNRLSGLVGDAE